MSTPTAPEPPDVIFEANSAEEFIALLRQILKRSGRTPGRVAVYSKLPRSTAYHFVSNKNTTLPTKRDQVEAFVRGCRLLEDEVVQVLEIWDRLAGVPTQSHLEMDYHRWGTASHNAHGRSIVHGSAGSGKTLAFRELADKLVGRVPLDLSEVKRGLYDPASTTERLLTDHGTIVGNFTVSHNTNVVKHDRTVRWPPSARTCAQILLFGALYPAMVLGTWGGSIAPRTVLLLMIPALVVVALLPQMLLRWRPRPTALVAAGLGAATVGGLTWLTAPIGMVAGLAALLGGVAILLWMDALPELDNESASVTRNVLTVVVSLGIGVLVGLMFTALGGPIAGAFLVGACTSAGVFLNHFPAEADQ